MTNLGKLFRRRLDPRVEQAPDRPGVDTPALLLNAETLECLHYEYVPSGTPTVSFPREKVSSVQDLDVRIDLLDCSIDICSADVPALFTENFDYQDLRVDFVHGVLTSDILGKTIYCHIPKQGYASRVKNTRTYSNVTYVYLLSNWYLDLTPL